jgi:hypothetical protein
MRTCTVCRESKPLAEFSPFKYGRDGLKPACKPCSNERQRIYRARHTGKERKCADCGSPFTASSSLTYCRPCRNRRDREYHRNRRLSDPEAARLAKKDKHLRHQYGITLAEYNDMLAAQGGGCAICGAERSVDGRTLAVDHCHATGRVRGLLCARCNYALGLIDDRPELLRRAAVYLEAS